MLKTEQLHRCPSCGKQSLAEQIAANGHIRHHCQGAECDYLMHWKPRQRITAAVRAAWLAEAQKYLSSLSKEQAQWLREHGHLLPNAA